MKEQRDPIAEARKDPRFKFWSWFYHIKYKLLTKIYNMIVGCESHYYNEMREVSKQVQ